MALTVAAIGIGAALGALLRWLLGLTLNALVPTLPMGTLAANLIAAYVVGLAVAYFGDHPGLSPAWRLFVITGFAGGLSTFSTFSMELLTVLREGRLGWSLAMLGLHVGGSLLMAGMGIASLSLVRSH